MGDIQIRPACADDAHAIAELLHRCVPKCVPLTVLGVLDHVGALMVATADGAVVGCARYEETSLGDEIRSVAVAPEHRGLGIGRLLVEAILRDAGPELACVTRTPAFFRSLGFELTSEIAPRPTVMASHAPRFVMRRNPRPTTNFAQH